MVRTLYSAHSARGAGRSGGVGGRGSGRSAHDGSPPPNKLPRRTTPHEVPPGALASPAVSASLLGLRGLNNLGNTCFMNCVLQAWLHCPPVTRFFLADNHNRFECAIRWRQVAAANGEAGGSDGRERTGTTPPPAKGTVAGRRMCLACEMDLLCSECFSGKHAPFSPHSFLHAMWSSCEYLAGYEQQDAHEFMVVALTGIYSGLAPARPGGGSPGGHASAFSTTTAIATGRASSASSGEANTALNAAGYELQRIFTGVMRSDVVCLKCGGKSNKFDAFQDVSLDLSRSAALAGGEADGSAAASAAEAGFHASLDACLRSFTRSERMAQAERCWCTACGGLQESSKQLSVHRLPNVLCFHLKRFERAHGKGNATSMKIDSMVYFPLHSLNMRPYTSEHIDAHSKHAPDGGGAPAAPAAAPPPDAVEPLPEQLYDLFGVTAHVGGISNGHYTSYVRSQAQWYLCDDSVVTRASEDAVRGCKAAYMLFYVQKKLSVCV